MFPDFFVNNINYKFMINDNNNYSSKLTLEDQEIFNFIMETFDYLFSLRYIYSMNYVIYRTDIGKKILQVHCKLIFQKQKKTLGNTVQLFCNKYFHAFFIRITNEKNYIQWLQKIFAHHYNIIIN